MRDYIGGQGYQDIGYPYQECGSLLDILWLDRRFSSHVWTETFYFICWMSPGTTTLIFTLSSSTESPLLFLL